MATRIEPKILKGFRDQLPQVTIPRNQMIETLQRVFSCFGFAPIDTPALEYAEILLGKGSQETDKQLYRFQDQGGRDVALRFDLTVPLARFAAMHINELGTPFRRFHIAPVWRAEKPQRGRYREFIQCDFDIIGTHSVFPDAEIISVIHSALNELKIGHRVRVNNRKILNGFLSQLGAADAASGVSTSTAVLRAIDKLDKLGEEKVREELTSEAGLSGPQIDRVFSFLALSTSAATNSDLLAELKIFFAESELASAGVSDLARVISALEQAGIGDAQCGIDLSIARGLDYYTGSVFETTMLDLPHIGSICSGGRYDNLASLYTSRDLPGVGASIGLDRILGAFEELGRFSTKSTTANVLVTLLDQASEGRSLALANQLRGQGINTELYPEPTKLGHQLKYASKKGIEFAVIAGEQELAQGLCSVKRLSSGEQVDNLPLAALANYLHDSKAVD